MKKTILLFFIFSFHFIFSQGWMKSFNFPPGTNSDPYNAKVGKDNAYYFVHHESDPNNTSFSQQFLLKLDTNGNLIWKKQLHHSIGAEFGNLNILSDCTIVLTGRASSTASTGYIKLDRNGNVLDSVKAMPGQYYYTLSFCYNDTLIMMGVNNLHDTTFVEKRDKNLNLIWRKYGSTTSTNSYDFSGTIDSVGNVFFLTRQPASPYDFLLLHKYDKNGNLLYARHINEQGAPFPMAMTNGHQIYVDESNKVKILTIDGSPYSFVSTYNEISDTTIVTHKFNTGIMSIMVNKGHHFLINYAGLNSPPWYRVSMIHKTDKDFTDMSNFIVFSDTISLCTLGDIDFDKNYLIIAAYSGVAPGGNTVMRAQYIKIDTSGNFNAPTLFGSTINDVNNNCLKDGGDLPIINDMVYANNGSQTYYSISDNSGNYNMYLPNGNYAVKAGEPYVSYDNCNVMSGLNLNVNSTFNTLNIPFNIPNYFDLTTTAYMSPPRPGFSNNLSVYYYNRGNISASNCLLKVKVDTAFKNIISNPAASYVITDTLFYNLGTITPYGSGYINITFAINSTATLGDTTHLTSSIFPISNDSIPSNNIYQENEIIVGSFDPNNKKVVPSGNGSQGYIVGNEKLEYLVQFQNTGSSYAKDVLVLDTISTNLDLSTFHIVDASHPFQIKLVNNNALQIAFDNINLPDSSTNQFLSHGFFRYTIYPKANLSSGTQINNTAYILFDFNSAIITNTTLNTIQSTTISIKNNKTAVNNNLITYPNPSNGNLVVSSSQIIDEIKIVDMLGQLIYEDKPHSQKLNLKIEYTGVYFVNIKTAEGMMTKKIVVQH